ncbi:hypothetical protein ACLOJK_000012 [Asimina triloba]
MILSPAAAVVTSSSFSSTTYPPSIYPAACGRHGSRRTDGSVRILFVSDGGRAGSERRQLQAGDGGSMQGRRATAAATHGCGRTRGYGLTRVAGSTARTWGCLQAAGMTEGGPDHHLPWR